MTRTVKKPCDVDGCDEDEQLVLIDIRCVIGGRERSWKALLCPTHQREVKGGRFDGMSIGFRVE